MKANPYISREELAELCGLTSDGIKYNIRKLRERESLSVLTQTKVVTGR